MFRFDGIPWVIRRGRGRLLRAHAIAINGVIDGLWIEGCLAGEMFETGELARIGIAAVEALLGLASPGRENREEGR